MFGLGVAAAARHSAAATGIVLGALLLPLIAAVLLPRSLGEVAEKATPMIGLAGLDDNAPVGQAAGLGISAAWAAASLVLALWLVRRRDA